MTYNEETPEISLYPCASQSKMIISGTVSGTVSGTIINKMIDNSTNVIYVDNDEVEYNGIVKSYNSIYDIANLTIITVPVGSTIKLVDEDFIGVTVETEGDYGNNIDILYDNEDIQRHSTLTNVDGFNSTEETDIVMNGQATVVLTAQSGVLDGLSFNMNNNATINIYSGDTLPRIDILVLEKNQSLFTIEANLIKGTPSTNPIAPTLTQAAFGLYQLPVFSIYVNAAQTSFSRNDITDLRTLTSKKNNVTYSNLAGTITAFAGDLDNIPENAILCDGRELSRATESRLFARIGTTWGAGDSSSTFNIPDLRDRALYGAGTSSSVAKAQEAALGEYIATGIIKLSAYTRIGDPDTTVSAYRDSSGCFASSSTAAGFARTSNTNSSIYSALTFNSTNNNP